MGRRMPPVLVDDSMWIRQTEAQSRCAEALARNDTYPFCWTNWAPSCGPARPARMSAISSCALSGSPLV